MKHRLIAAALSILLMSSCTTPLIVEKQVPAAAPPAQVVIVPQAQPIIIRDSAAEVNLDALVEARIKAIEAGKTVTPPAAGVKTEIRYIGCRQDFVLPDMEPPPVLSADTFSKIPRDQHAVIQGALVTQVEKLDKYIKDMKAKYAEAYAAYRKSCKK